MALAVGIWPARVDGGSRPRAGSEGPVGPQTHLCDEAARRASPHCEFRIGADTVLRVPWDVFRGEPTLYRQHPGSSMHPQPYPSPSWPVRHCYAYDTCAWAFSRVERGEAPPGQHPNEWESWRLDGAVLANGQVVPSGEAPRENAKAFSLAISTSRRGLGWGPRASFERFLADGWREEGTTLAEATGLERATVVLVLDEAPWRHAFEVSRRSGERILMRECGVPPRRPPGCAVEGRSGDLFLVVAWSADTTLGTDEAVAAAASLFNRYVASGPGLAP